MYEKPLVDIPTNIRLNGIGIDSRYAIARINHRNKISFYTNLGQHRQVNQRDRWAEKPSDAREFDTYDEARQEACQNASRYVTGCDRLVVVKLELSVIGAIEVTKLKS